MAAGDGARVQDRLLHRGVIVRPLGQYGLPEWSNKLADQISLLSQEVHMQSASAGPNSDRGTLVGGVDYLAHAIEAGQEL